MTAKAFNTIAKAPESYVFDLDREVAAFYRDYPEQKKKIFFIEASTTPEQLYRGDETDLDEIAELLSTNLDLQKGVQETQVEGSKAQAYLRLGYGCVLLNPLPSQKNALGYKAGQAVSDAFIFDHETGHLLCEKGLSDFNLSECIADAYAALRHFQRFGKDTAAIQKLLQRRAVEITFDKTGEHFTAPVLEKIIADSRKTDFSALTPLQTVIRAQRYAEENALEAQLVKYITNDFKTPRFKLQEMIKGDFRALHALGDFVLKTTIPEEFKWGAVAVRALLDGGLVFNGICLPKPEGNEWTRLRQAIDARAAVFEQPQKSRLIIPRDYRA